MISQREIEVLKLHLTNALYGGVGQDVRIEWITKSGGIADNVWDVTTGGTDTTNILNARGIVMDAERYQGKLRIVENAIEYQHNVIWLLETDVNLKNQTNFILLQLLKDQYNSGSGTGSGSVWTVSGSSWTVNQWAGFWLVFSDKRFEIVSNTATQLTVTLAGETLPASSSYEIMGIKEWYPFIPAPTLEDTMGLALGDGQLLQSVYCSQVPTKGA